MAKFTWTIESDDAKEAVRINEEMAMLAYRIGKNKQPSRSTKERAEPEGEIEIINPVTNKTSVMKLTAGAVRDQVDMLLGWLAAAKTAGELKQIITVNAEVIKDTLSSAQQRRIGAAVTKREDDLIAAARTEVIPPGATNDDPAPTQDQLNKEFKILFDTHGLEACQQILASFKVQQLKDLPKGLWSSALAAIRSSMAVNGVKRP